MVSRALHVTCLKLQWRLTNFVPHQEEFILTRTTELCARTLNEELNKLGYKDVIDELNNSPLYINTNSPTTAEPDLPGEVLSRQIRHDSVG